MGQIIPFKCGARRRDPPPPGAEAEILFFLGVRYSRDDSGDQTGGKPKRPSSSRPRRNKRA